MAVLPGKAPVSTSASEDQPSTTITTTPLTTPAATTSGTVTNAIDNTEIASNFTEFLQLLTTQLKNQNPLDPLDTNQFTQQLVQFAQVEQQLTSTITSCAPSCRCRKAQSQATAALAYRRRHRGRERRHRPAQSTASLLDDQRSQALDRHYHHHEFHRADRLYRHLRRQSGHTDFYLGRPRQ